MIHPVFQNKKVIIYIGVWLVVMIGHSSLLELYYHLPRTIAIADSVVYNVIFAFAAPWLWYFVKASHLNNQSYFTIVTSQVGTCIAFVGLWIYASQELLISFFPDNLFYQSIVDQVEIGRYLEGILLYALFILIYYLLIFYHNFKEKIIQEEKNKTHLKEAELEKLKSQINPHFIFNSLNSINSLTISHPEKAQEMIVKLSSFLRFSLGQKIHETTTLEQELKNIELYLEIEKVRFGELLHTKFDISTDAFLKTIPNMLLQPLVENAIKYGVYESTEVSTILITGIVEKETLHLSIVNSFDPTSIPNKGQGIGLKNILERLQLIYGHGNWIQIRKDKNSFLVELRLPQT